MSSQPTHPDNPRVRVETVDSEPEENPPEDLPQERNNAANQEQDTDPPQDAADDLPQDQDNQPIVAPSPRGNQIIMMLERLCSTNKVPTVPLTRATVTSDYFPRARESLWQAGTIWAAVLQGTTSVTPVIAVHQQTTPDDVTTLFGIAVKGTDATHKDPTLVKFNEAEARLPLTMKPASLNSVKTWRQGEEFLVGQNREWAVPRVVPLPLQAFAHLLYTNHPAAVSQSLLTMLVQPRPRATTELDITVLGLKHFLQAASTGRATETGHDLTTSALQLAFEYMEDDPTLAQDESTAAYKAMTLATNSKELGELLVEFNFLLPPGDFPDQPEPNNPTENRIQAVDNAPRVQLPPLNDRIPRRNRQPNPGIGDRLEAFQLEDTIRASEGTTNPAPPPVQPPTPANPTRGQATSPDSFVLPPSRAPNPPPPPNCGHNTTGPPNHQTCLLQSHLEFKIQVCDLIENKSVNEGFKNWLQTLLSKEELTAQDKALVTRLAKSVMPSFISSMKPQMILLFFDFMFSAKPSMDEFKADPDNVLVHIRQETKLKDRILIVDTLITNPLKRRFPALGNRLGHTFNDTIASGAYTPVLYGGSNKAVGLGPLAFVARSFRELNAQRTLLLANEAATSTTTEDVLRTRLGDPILPQSPGELQILLRLMIEVLTFLFTRFCPLVKQITTVEKAIHSAAPLLAEESNFRWNSGAEILWRIQKETHVFFSQRLSIEDFNKGLRTESCLRRLTEDIQQGTLQHSTHRASQFIDPNRSQGNRDNTRRNRPQRDTNRDTNRGANRDNNRNPNRDTNRRVRPRQAPRTRTLPAESRALIDRYLGGTDRPFPRLRDVRAALNLDSDAALAQRLNVDAASDCLHFALYGKCGLRRCTRNHEARPLSDQHTAILTAALAVPQGT